MDTEHQPLLPTMPDLSSEPAADSDPTDAPARLLRPDRHQHRLEDICLDTLVPADHRVRMIWAFVERQDFSGPERRIKSRAGRAGAPAIDPKILLALWLLATTQGVGSARELDRLCQEHVAYRWLCGGVGVNYHTLSDWRVEQGDFLDDLLTEIVTSLCAAGIVDPKEIMQDGTKTRASAGAGSFRSREGLEKLREEVKGHIQRVKTQDPELTERVRAARERAAQERLERVEAALKVMPELEAIKKTANKKKRAVAARASTTDADARKMRMADGGTRPAYNVQFATDSKGRAIVGVNVVQSSSDNGQREAMRKQVEERTGVTVKSHVTDGAYFSKEGVEREEAAGVAVVMPLPTNANKQKRAADEKDGPGMRAWYQRMATPEAEALLKRRFGVAETPNAEMKTYRGMDRMLVRGIKKVRSVVLLGAVTYNLLHFWASLT